MGEEKSLVSPRQGDLKIPHARQPQPSIMLSRLPIFFALSSLALAICVCLPLSPILLQAGHVLFHKLLDPLCPSAHSSNFPHSPSWVTWWHPQSPISWQPCRNDQRWNLLYHLGGNGPWIEKIEGVLRSREGIGPPAGCTVDNVQMMSRHAERYPTHRAGGRHLDLLARIRDSRVVLNGSLSFVNGWTYFTNNPSEHFDQLTRTGPYAGTLQAFATGVRLRTRYSHLLSSQANTRFWASDSARVVETAQHFAAGFFGVNWERDRKAHLEIIPKTEDRGANTLSPAATCTRYIHNVSHGRGYGVSALSRFQQVYLPSISDRLAQQNPNLRFTNQEIYSMQQMCGFETITRGSSPWCAVFTQRDWLHYEYARDVLHYFRAGRGNPYGPVMGWLWLNATTELLLDRPKGENLFFSFVQDGDIASMLAALDIFHDPLHDPHLPTTHIATSRAWRTSQVMAMGGRIIFERLACSPTSATDVGGTQWFVRININDGIVPLPNCSSGPGHSCPLSQFAERIRQRGIEVGDFREVCGINPEYDSRITFLHQ